MEHPHLSGFAELVVADILRLPGIYRTRVFADGRYATAAFNPSESFLRDRHLLNCTFMAGQAGDYHSNVAPNWERAGRTRRCSRPHVTSDRRSQGGDSAVDAARPLAGTRLCLRAGTEPGQPGHAVGSSVMHSACRGCVSTGASPSRTGSVHSNMRSLVMEIGALDIGRVFDSGEYDDAWPRSSAVAVTIWGRRACTTIHGRVSSTELQGSWYRQSVCRRQFGISDWRRVQSDPYPGRTGAAPG